MSSAADQPKRKSEPNYVQLVATGFETAEEYFELSKRDLAEMVGSTVTLVATPQAEPLRWADPRTILMRLPGGTHIARFHRAGRVFQGVESGLIRSYAETLDDFSEVPRVFTTSASDDVLTAAVVARCVTDLDRRRVLETALRLIIQQSTKTYEGSRIAVNACVDFGDTRPGQNLVQFLDQPWSAVLGSGIASAIMVGQTGSVVELLQLGAVNPANVRAPEPFAQLAGWTDGNTERIALAATRSGEVYLFVGGEAAFVRRNSRWRGLPLDMLSTIGWMTAKRKLTPGTKSAVLLALLDASAAHHGACIGVVSPLARVETALTELVAPAERWDNADNPRRSVIHATDFAGLSRRHRLELLSMDGATLLDRNGRILAAGAILQVEPGSTGGGRTAAAKMLGKYGVGIKVSQDGPVIAYSGDDSEEIFRMG